MTKAGVEIMRPFLGIDITKSKKNEFLEGEEFIIASTSEVQVYATEQALEDAAELMKKAQLPLVLRMIMYICGVLGMIGFVGILRASNDTDGVSISEMYQNAPWLLWGMGICLTIAGILHLLNQIKKNATLKKDESQYTIDKIEKMCSSAYEELGVPGHAKKAIVLSFTYKVKKGMPVAKEVGFKMTPYENSVARIWGDETCLYIADVAHKYAFPLSDLQAIRTINKSISIPGWSKEDSHPNAGKYKKYKMQVDRYGCIHFKPYHILELNHNGELWGIYFPCYELDVFEKSTGLKAE